MCLYLDFLCVYFKSLHFVNIRIHLRTSEICELGATVFVISLWYILRSFGGMYILVSFNLSTSLFKFSFSVSELLFCELDNFYFAKESQ